MAVFAIGDLHLSLGNNKPMDVFPGWDNYLDRLQDNWLQWVTSKDTVVLAGDTSWAMKLEDCERDFSFLQQLPGQKLLLKGNHDYWWTTMSKMGEYVYKERFTSISFLHNNSHFADGMMICGTRSWLFDDGEPQDQKIMNREIGRLRTSLQEAHSIAPYAPKIVFLHYPPLYPGVESTEMIQCMKEFGVKHCCYGHLHGASISRAVQGKVDGIHYHLISADALDFTPLAIDFA